MAYQQTYRAVSNPVHGTKYNSPYSAMPQSVISRRPGNNNSSSRSGSPLPIDNSQGQPPAYRPQSRNQLSGPHSPQPSRPLSSFPPELDTDTPTVAAPVISEYQQPNYRQQPRAIYDYPTPTSASSATSATSTTFPLPPSQNPIYKRQTDEQVQIGPQLPPQYAPRSQPPQNLPQPQTQPPPPPPSVPTTNTTAPSTTSSSSLPQSQIDTALSAVLKVQTDATIHHSKRPFAALLLGPSPDYTILQTHNSLSHYQHAESELARLVAAQYSQSYLSQCTLVSTWEPCAMCAGTIYWTGIGRVLYAASEEKLKEVTGPGNEENMTMSLPCRTIFNAGQRNVEVVGPVPEWETKVVNESSKWWRENTLQKIAERGRNERERSTSLSVKGSTIGSGRSTNGPGSRTASLHEKNSSVSVYDPSDSYLGRIGEDGEYQADLKVDWMR